MSNGDDVIRVADQYYILATSSLHDERSHVLKDGESFAIFDRRGDVRPFGQSTQGLYVGDTRFLSKCSLLLEGERPLLLSSTVHSAGALLIVDLTNPDIKRGDVLAIPHGSLHLQRTLLLHDGVLRQRIKVSNFAAHHVDVTMAVDVDADFTDIFEVRGHRREARGHRSPPDLASGRLTLSYVGLDGGVRRTVIACSPAASIVGTRATFHVSIPARGSRIVHVTARCGGPAKPKARPRVRPPLLRDAARIHSSSARLDGWVERSQDDLRMMLTRTELGPYPYAGVPWFSTVFGRDGIITALQTLWLDASIARGVLMVLAATQARELDARTEAEPGKIIHETRNGEMAALGEVPFGRYYGTVDATPLFIVLAGQHLAATGDLELARTLWPNITAALRWMDRYGDLDGDGFLEYRSSVHGLIHQGWKDSNDSIFHADGAPAESPIALCEVQGYAYAARLAAAAIGWALGHEVLAADEEQKAERLRLRFEDQFWCEELRCYGIALDGKKRLCRVRSSNAGHCLWSGIASPERAAAMASTLTDDASFSGWGVRTVASGASRYNPMSYHNGSVWPHDNAIIALGLARYGHKKQALQIFAAMLDATRHFELQRLPELFCGFARSHGKGPTLYPVACSPQAWASGAVYMMLQACLGLSVDAGQRRVSLSMPQLPPLVRELSIDGLRVGDHASVDLTMHRYPDGIGVDVRSRRGDVEVMVLK